MLSYTPFAWIAYKWAIRGQKRLILFSSHSLYLANTHTYTHTSFYDTRLIEHNWTVCDLYVGCYTHFNANKLLMNSRRAQKRVLLLLLLLTQSLYQCRSFFGMLLLLYSGSTFAYQKYAKRFTFFALSLSLSMIFVFPCKINWKNRTE